MVENHPDLYGALETVARALAPQLRLVRLHAPSMGGEDVAYFMQKAPGLLVRLGMGRDASDLHTPTFDFNDQAIPTGMLALAGLVFYLGQDFLNKHKR